jgi:hypothetical protein
MRRSTTLESRLTDWAREFRGGRYENVGWQGVSSLAVAMKYHGPAPQGLNPRRIETNTPADEVEAALKALARQPAGLVPATVLRCEYLASSQPRVEKLRRLARIGHSMDTARFSQHLRLAKVHVAAWIRVEFDEPLDDTQAVSMLEFLVT